MASILYSLYVSFHHCHPTGWLGQYFALSVCLSVCLSVSHTIPNAPPSPEEDEEKEIQ